MYLPPINLIVELSVFTLIHAEFTSLTLCETRCCNIFLSKKKKEKKQPRQYVSPFLDNLCV